MKQLTWACTVATCVVLSGCAANTMDSRQQNTAMGAGAGALMGGLVGGLLGGGKWAAIGAASGAALGGLAGYALSPDPLTQYSAQTANEWQQNMGARAEATQVTPVAMSNGQKVNQIDEMRLTVPSSKMETGGRLSPNGESVIRKMINNTESTGGSVQINYPANAPKAVVQKLLDTGANVQRGPSSQNQYVFLIRRAGT